MTKVVKKACNIGFDELGLVRIEARVFPQNTGSITVLERVGFTYEGINRKHILRTVSIRMGYYML